MQKFLIAEKTMPFPKKPEKEFAITMSLYGYLGGINPDFEDNARANLYPTFPLTMSIADQKVWEEYISSQINELNKITQNNYKYLHNNLDNSLSLGEIDGNNKIALSSFPLEMTKTAINLCTYSYLNCKEGDILDGFTILKIVEIYSWIRFYYIYAFIGVKKTADSTVYSVVFRGTLNALQWTADFMLAPYDETIKIKGREFIIDYTTGFYKCVNNKKNNTGQSAFDTILKYLLTHIGSDNKGKANLLLTGHSAGAMACNVLTLGLFQDVNQVKYGTLFNEINCITFGEGVSGRKAETRLVNQFILDSFPHFKYYTVVNNLDIFPCLNTVFYTGFHAHNDGYLIQYKDKRLYKITPDNLAYGQFLNGILYYLYHLLWLNTNIKGQLLFFQILVLLFCYSIYNHSILNYKTALDELE